MTVAVTAVVVLLVGMLQTLLGGLLVQRVFQVVDRRDPVRPGADDPGLLQGAASQLRGGAWIGGLERLAIYTAILAGYPEGIAITLAVKGLARYPELAATTSGAAERFIIGTFTSVLVAVAAAGVAHALIGLL